MCNCISELVNKRFIERECVYENRDFVDKGYQIRKYTKRGHTITATNCVFRINYCPACGMQIKE